MEVTANILPFIRDLCVKLTHEIVSTACQRAELALVTTDKNINDEKNTLKSSNEASDGVNRVHERETPLKDNINKEETDKVIPVVSNKSSKLVNNFINKNKNNLQTKHPPINNNKNNESNGKSKASRNNEKLSEVKHVNKPPLPTFTKPMSSMKKSKSTASFFKIDHQHHHQKSVAFHFLNDLTIQQQQDMLQAIRLLLQDSVISLCPDSQKSTNWFHSFLPNDLQDIHHCYAGIENFYEALAVEQISRNKYTRDLDLSSFAENQVMIPLDYQHDIYFDEEMKLTLLKLFKTTEKTLSRKYKQLNRQAQGLFEQIESKFAHQMLLLDTTLSTWHGIDHYFKSPDFTMIQVIDYSRNKINMIKQYFLELYHPTNAILTSPIVNPKYAAASTPAGAANNSMSPSSPAQRLNHQHHLEKQFLNQIHADGYHPLQRLEGKFERKYIQYIEMQANFVESIRQKYHAKQQLERFVECQLSKITTISDDLTELDKLLLGKDNTVQEIEVEEEGKRNFFAFKKLTSASSSASPLQPLMKQQHQRPRTASSLPLRTNEDLSRQGHSKNTHLRPLTSPHAANQEQHRAYSKKTTLYEGLNLQKAAIPMSSPLGNDLSYHERELLLANRISVNRVRSLLRNGFTLSKIAKLQTAQDLAFQAYINSNQQHHQQQQQQQHEQQHHHQQHEQQHEQMPIEEEGKAKDKRAPTPILTALFDDVNKIQPSKQNLALSKETIQLYGFSPAKAQQIFGGAGKHNGWLEKVLKANTTTAASKNKATNKQPTGGRGKRKVNGDDKEDEGEVDSDEELEMLLFGKKTRSVDNNNNKRSTSATPVEDLTINTVAGGTTPVVNLHDFMEVMEEVEVVRPSSGQETVNKIQMKVKSNPSSPMIMTPDKKQFFFAADEQEEEARTVEEEGPGEGEGDAWNEGILEKPEEETVMLNVTATVQEEDSWRVDILSEIPPPSSSPPQPIILIDESPPAPETATSAATSSNDKEEKEEAELLTRFVQLLQSQNSFKSYFQNADNNNNDNDNNKEGIAQCKQALQLQIEAIAKQFRTHDYTMNDSDDEKVIAIKETEILQDYHEILTLVELLQTILQQFLLQPYHERLLSSSNLQHESKFDTILWFLQKGLDYSSMKDNGVLLLPVDITGKRVLSAPTMRKKSIHEKKGSLPEYIPLIHHNKIIDLELDDENLASLVRQVIPNSPNKSSRLHKLEKPHYLSNHYNDPTNHHVSASSIMDQHYRTRETVLANGAKSLLDQKLQNYLYSIMKLQKAVTRSYYNLLEIRMAELIYLICYLQCASLKFHYVKEHHHQLTSVLEASLSHHPPEESVFQTCFAKLEVALRSFTESLPVWNHDEFLIAKKQLQIQQFAQAIGTFQELVDKNMQEIDDTMQMMYTMNAE